MNLSNICLKQREKEATTQKYLLVYALIGSGLVHLLAALGSNFLWQKTPEITEEPIEVIMVDAPKPEVKPPEPKPKAVKPPEIKPKPTPIPETKIVNTPTRPINPIQKPEPLKTTVKAPPRPPAEVAASKPKPVATKPEPAPKRPVAAAPPLSNPPRKNPQVEGISSTLNRTTTSPPKEDNEPVMTSPGNVATGDVPVQKPVTNSAPIPSSSENVGQLRDSFGAEDASTNAANPGGTDEGSSTSNSPGDVAINQAPSKPAQEGGGGGDSEGSSEGGGGVRCISNCQPDYPSSITEKVEGRPVVRITIAENGNVVGSQLASSSGNSQLDQAAIVSAKEMVFDPPGTQVAVRVAINFTLENSDFHQEALERERQAQQQREQKEKERQAQIERERQARLERDRKEKERQAQLQQQRQQQQEQQRQQNIQRERQRVQQQRQQQIEQNSRQQEQQRQQPNSGQQTQPQQPPNRLPSVLDERP